MSGCISRFTIMMLLIVQSISAALAQSGDNVEQIRDYIGLSRSFLGVNNQKAQELALKALESARLSGVDSLKAKAHRFSGIASYYLSDFNQSIFHYDSALYYFTRLHDSIEQARIYNNRGAVYTQLNLFQKAIGEYIQARDIYQNLNNVRGMIILHNNIGSLYQYLREYETATYYYMKALEIARANGYNEELITALSNIATIYELEQRIGDAEQTYRDALNQAARVGSQAVNATLHLNFGSFWVEQRQPDSALRHYFKAREYYRDMNLNLAKLYLGMARAYKMKGQADEAYSHFKLALDNVGKGNDAVLRLRILKELAELTAKRGDYASAYRMLTEFADETELFRNENDSLKNTLIQLHFTINNLESKADSLSANLAESQLLASMHKSKRNILYFFLIFLIASSLVIGVLLFHYLKAYRQQKIIIDQKNREQDQLLTENMVLHQSKLELSNVQNLLRALVGSSPNPLGIKNGNNEWLIANDAMCSLMGLGPGQLDGCNAQRLASLSRRSENFLRTLEVAEEIAWMRGETMKMKESLSDKEGELIGEFFVIRVPVFEDDGARKFMIIYLLPANQNIPEQKTNGSLSIIKALSVLSHEIRTPLNAVVGFSDILASEELEQAKRRQYSRIIQRNCNVLLKLMDDLLLYSSLESGNPEILVEAFDFRELFVNLHTRLLNKALELGKHNIEVKLSIPDLPCIIHGDEVRWQQILDNLGDNAVRFTQKGYIVMGFNVKNTNEVRQINVFIEDTGSGIPEEMQKSVFDPFVRLAEHQGKGSGAGLGLSIVSLLAEKMNVMLKMSSKPGKGTKVELLFEAQIQNDTSEPQKWSLPRYTGKLAGKKVLIVEDVESNTELLRIILQGAGAIVHHVDTGEDAVKTCFDENDIDLVLMDIQLPKMNGLEATRQIKSFRPGLPIIAHTAYAMANEKDACFEAGCDGYVAKPVKPRLLLPILEQLFKK